MEDKVNEYIRIGTRDPLEAGEYTLTTSYIGFLKPNNFGFYISEYQGQSRDLKLTLS